MPFWRWRITSAIFKIFDLIGKYKNRKFLEYKRRLHFDLKDPHQSNYLIKMNLIAIAVSAAALISSVAANISFALPTSGAIWYTRTPNYMSVISNNAAEQYATVRFSACRECFALTVATNTTVPIILPRHFRSNNYLNLFAVSNSMNTASTLVSVIDSLCIVPGNPCKKPCKWERRRGCGYYAQESANAENDASQAELVYVAHDSEEAKAMKAQQEQAAADLAEDILAIESA